MKKPERLPRARDNHGDSKAILLAVALGLASVAGISSVVLDRVEKALQGGQIEEENFPDEVDAGEEADAEILDTPEIEAPRREIAWKAKEAAKWDGDYGLEVAHALVYQVESECDIELPSPLDYDARSQDERDTCMAMPEQSGFIVCIEDATFHMIENTEKDVGTPMFDCESYNYGSPQEACLEDAIRVTKERAFYECRDAFLTANEIQEEYHRAQIRIFDENMKYIKRLLDKLSANENYRPNSAELLEYFTAYNQLRNLRDFDMVMDQMDLGEKSDFVQIYGKDVKELILDRGCSDKEVDLQKILMELLPT